MINWFSHTIFQAEIAQSFGYDGTVVGFQQISSKNTTFKSQCPDVSANLLSKMGSARWYDVEPRGKVGKDYENEKK